MDMQTQTKGLSIPRYFTKEGVSPTELFTYEMRTSCIKNPDGSTVFQMHDVEVPSFWTQVATDILAQKYFRKAGVPLRNARSELLRDENGKVILGSENSIKQVAHRIAGCWRHWGEQYGYFASSADAQHFYDEMMYMIIGQVSAPNSPQWFTTGLHWAYGLTGPAQGHSYVDPATGKLEYSKDAYSRSQPHACFIQKLDDDLVRDGGIFSLLTREARIFKYGSGTGSNFSNLRGKGERLSGGGSSSGLMSFLKIFDTAAGSVKSGGTTRRAAKMVSLDLDHPEIEEFIWWKVREEEKVAGLVAGSKILSKKLSKLIALAKNKEEPLADKEVREALKSAANANIPLSYLVRSLDLAKQGYEMPLREFDTHYESEAYQTVSGQNSNNSIRIPNLFFEVLQKNGIWELKGRSDGKVFKTIPAQKLWDDVGYCAWASADPGVQFDTTINEWHTCPEDGRINGSNPCVTGDTRVLLPEGRWARINSLLNKEGPILVNTGFIQEVLINGSFKTGIKPVYKLTTKAGYELKLTADHKVFTVNRGFVPACELTKNDSVLLPGQEVAQLEEIPNKTFYQMLGVYLGDGCGGAISNTRGIQITMNKESEMQVLETFAEYVAMTYERSTHRDTPALVQVTKTSGKYVITNTRVIEEFQQFVDLQLKSHEKCISEAIFNSSLSIQKYILQGLFTADGTVGNYNVNSSYYVSLDSTSIQLLKDVQLLLLGFGIKSKLYLNRRAGKDMALLPDGKGGLKEYSVREMYSLRISRQNRVKFEELIGFMEESPKSEQLKKINECSEAYREMPIDAISALEYLGEEEVFDLTEPFTSTFVANGITVHNCSEYMFLDDTACNLASINLMKFYDETTGKFDIAGYRHTIRLWTVALEISVLMAQFPSEQIAQKSYVFRTLGLGFANLGTLLMVQGIPYDSEKARALAGALAAIMTGDAYAASAEMAQTLGPFEGFQKNREHMLRVIRNHRRAIYDTDTYEGLTITPKGVDQDLCSSEVLEAAHDSWDKALQWGEQQGYRNAQTTVIAPTGTIGLVMSCDTTGVEPDYSLVKFKKLAGGGYFKIVNQAVPSALRRLGYTADQIKEIIAYCIGHGTLQDSPFINKEVLLQHGITAEQLAAVEKELLNSMDIRYAFHQGTLGKAYQENFLESFGFNREQIEAANEYICGTQTLEGAPYLKPEHYPIFDCANKCGKKGLRYIHPYGHLKMLAAVQPFISGAISKTINMPREWTVNQIKQAYYDAWKMMIKATALYRDGCKLSQPLNTTLEENPELKALLAEKEEEKEREAEELLQSELTKRVLVGRKELKIKGKLDNGNLAEISVWMDGLTPAQEVMTSALVSSVNMSLAHGISPITIAQQSLAVEGHPLVSELRQFLSGFAQSNGASASVQVAGKIVGNGSNGNNGLFAGVQSNGHSHIVKNGNGGVGNGASFSNGHTSLNGANGLSVAKETVQSSKKGSCHSCGAAQMRQNGTCMLCEVCGETSGCS